MAVALATERVRIGTMVPPVARRLTAPELRTRIAAGPRRERRSGLTGHD
jgi:hypothetical protein